MIKDVPAVVRRPGPAGLGFYVRLGEQTSARVTAEHDPAARLCLR